VRKHAAEDPRIEIIENEGGNLGVVRNFENLLQTALGRDAEYFACADQDDIWHPEKLRIQLQAMASVRSLRRPTLVFTDLRVADEQLMTLDNSYMDFQGVRDPGSVDIKGLLLQNIVVGNTILADRALLRAALPFPYGIHMHDWWLALCAAAFGGIHFVPVPTVTYRLHGGNQAGAAGRGAGYRFWTKSWWRSYAKMRHLFVRSFAQAGYLRQRLYRESRGTAAPGPTHTAAAAIEAHLAMLDSNPINRIARFVRGDARCPTRILNVFVLLQLMDGSLVASARKRAMP
jgi:rhamnosyltransferase